MDILAARKKAAEKAKAHQAETDARPATQTDPATEHEPAEPVRPPVPAEETGGPLGDFPPIPDTSFVSDEPWPAPEPSPAAEKTPSAPTVQPAAKSVSKPTALGPEGGPDQSREQREQALEMLSFLLGSEEYAVPVEQVREILTPQEITPVPHTADYLLGVCSLRGTVMPVIDLNRRLGLSVSLRDEKSRIVVVSLERDDQVGLFVDRVRGVVRIAPSAVQPAPETVEQGGGAEFVKGIARMNERLYILLDVEKAAGPRQMSEAGL